MGKKLLISPHPTEGFSPALRDRILKLSKETKKKSLFKRIPVSLMPITLCIVILLFCFREISVDHLKEWITTTEMSELQSTTIHQWLTDPKFSSSLQSIIYKHQFPQTLDSFREVTQAENGEKILYSEITVADLSQHQNEKKVSYRIKINHLSQDNGEPITIELSIQWTANLNEKERKESWIYEFIDGQIKLLTGSNIR